jgi:membrane-bound inhibitor of C-type lysozyme
VTRARTNATRTASFVALLALAACGSSPSKEEIEAAKNSFTCQLAGERLVIKLDTGEARLLMPDGDRVSLYQIPAASGVRYSNGSMELRGKGTELQFIRDGAIVPLTECLPYAIPK